MELSRILEMTDHTLLARTAVWEEIRAACDDAVRLHTASVCIPPSYVKQAKEYVGEQMAVCTVVGFPNGYNTTAVKAYETKDAVENGADEIDMVINAGWVKDKMYDAVEEEIRIVKCAAGDKVLKVIVETCLLSGEEKTKLCEVVSRAGADYIKTSTGFSTGGATFEDIKLFSEHVKGRVKIKAAGGISSLEEAEEFIKLGASRLGTSRIVKIAKEKAHDTGND